jgi:hypothetical protein
MEISRTGYDIESGHRKNYLGHRRKIIVTPTFLSATPDPSVHLITATTFGKARALAVARYALHSEAFHRLFAIVNSCEYGE